MRALLLYPAALLVAGAIAEVFSAPTAAAIPQCTNTTPTTTQCERPGNAQINTSPGVTGFSGPFFGWPWLFSGTTISIGGPGGPW
jgi:hypothetical protein